MDDALRSAFDPARFRADGHRLIDLLADYLARAQRREVPVLPPVTPDEMAAAWPAEFPDAGGGALADLVGRVLDGANHLHHPRFVGHQVAAPLPAAALCDLVAALLNNGMAVFEMGPASTAMERALTRWLAARLGFPDGAGGVLTSGGSLGNLTALAAARRARAGFDAWEAGAAAGPPLAVLASADAHYSVDRAARLMGLGAGGVVPIPVDERHRMRVDALAGGLAAARRDGRRVFAVVAHAGSTAVGAYDPLDAIADFCAANQLWLHVDGAHGASAVMSPRHRHLVDGIARADSVVWDAHKLLLTPALCTAVLFRDGAHGYAAFAQEASYLFHGAGDEWWNVGLRTVECTKRMMSLKLYAALALYGTRLFADHVAATFDLAARFAARLAAADDFELAVAPECDIVCFRFLGARGDLDAAQGEIRRRVLAGGRFYLVQTRLPRGVFLRTTLINPLTTDEDLAALLDEIRRVGVQIAP